MPGSVIDCGKANVLGVMVDALDYEAAVDRVLTAARARRPYSCTALAVHGVMTGVLDPEQRYRLNAMDLLTPDGQPVRWALNSLHGTELPDRVYGPNLMLELCAAAAEDGLGVYLYGASRETVELLSTRLRERFPGLLVSGAEPSLFRRMTPRERGDVAERIRGSGAALTFVGLGCPRQEVFAYECAADLSMPVVSVGAAFDYHAGIAQQPPEWMQRAGLQWAYRLGQDPQRLWRRYLGLSALYVLLFALQRLGLWRPETAGRHPRERLSHG